MIENKFLLVCVMCLVCGCAGGNSGSDLNASDIGDVSATDIADTASHDGTVIPDVVDDEAVGDVDVSGPDLLDSIDAVYPDVAGDASDIDGVVDAGDTADVKVDWPCPTYGAPTVVGNLDDSPLTEASGLAASRKHAGVLWSHNDSNNVNDPDYVFAIVTNPSDALVGPGTIVYQYTFKDFSLIDQEDIAIGPFAGIEGDAIFLADVGDNSFADAERRREFVTVYVFAEPDVIATSEIDKADVIKIDVKYPDGWHDCEAFFVDPLTGDLYFVVKEYDLKVTKVYMMPAPAADFTAGEVPVTLTLVGEFPLQQATGADMSQDGLILVVRGYENGRYFQRQSGESIGDMLTGKNCVLPTFPGEPYFEIQGEAIAMAPDGKGFYTVSERLLSPQDIHFTPLNP